MQVGLTPLAPWSSLWMTPVLMRPAQISAPSRLGTEVLTGNICRPWALFKSRCPKWSRWLPLEPAGPSSPVLQLVNPHELETGERYGPDPASLPNSVITESYLLYIRKHFPIRAPSCPATNAPDRFLSPLTWGNLHGLLAHLPACGSSPSVSPHSSHSVLSKVQIWACISPSPHLADSYSPHVQAQGLHLLGRLP